MKQPGQVFAGWPFPLGSAINHLAAASPQVALYVKDDFLPSNELAVAYAVGDWLANVHSTNATLPSPITRCFRCTFSTDQAYFSDSKKKSGKLCRLPISPARAQALPTSTSDFTFILAAPLALYLPHYTPRLT